MHIVGSSVNIPDMSANLKAKVTGACYYSRHLPRRDAGLLLVPHFSIPPFSRCLPPLLQ